MTPKEKAKELVGLYQAVIVDLNRTVRIGSTERTSKQCALIAVDEIICLDVHDLTINQLKYWQEVKNEIEKL